jgi:nicotinamide-nucleotide amidase
MHEVLLSDRLLRAAQALGLALQARGCRLSTAESCTGGMVAAACTAHAGASAWFEQGLVTYSNAAKTRLLGVSPQLLDAHGAVSEPVVQAMAQGALGPAQAALAISGVAGPGGGSVDKPVGLVCLGFAWQPAPAQRVPRPFVQAQAARGQDAQAQAAHAQTAHRWSTSVRLPGDRWQIRDVAACLALETLLTGLHVHWANQGLQPDPRIPPQGS